MNTPLPEAGGGFEARLLAAIGQTVIGADADFNIVYWNAGAERVLGHKASEVLGKSLPAILDLKVEEAQVDRFAKRLSQGTPVSREFSIRRSDGSSILVLAIATPMMDDEGEFLGTVLVGTDITALKAAEVTMARLSAIVESSSDAIIGMDLSGVVTSWNAGAEQIFGPRAENAIGQNVRSFPGSELTREIQAVFEALGRGRVVRGISFESTRSDGSQVAVESTVYPVRTPDGELIGAAAIARDVTERRALEQTAADEHRRLEEAQRIAKVGSFEFDFDTGASQWSREFRSLLDFEPDQPPDYRQFVSRLHSEDHERFLVELGTWVGSGERLLETEFRSVTNAGDVRFMAMRVEMVRDAEGSPLSMAGSIHDKTDEKTLAMARVRAEEQFAVTFDLGRVGMVVVDPDQTIMRANGAFCELIERSNHEVVGHKPGDFLHPLEVEPPNVSFAERLLRSDQQHLTVEARFLRPSGAVVHCEVHSSLVRDLEGDARYVIAQIVDITDRKQVEDELQRLAMHDPLTGLPNRYLLQDRLATALGRARRAHQKVAVLFVDVDHFKLVNDSLGHSTGDTLLVQLASRLTHLSRSGDTVARFGGDEFVVVCEAVRDAVEAQAIGQRLLKLFDEPFVIADQPLYVTVSAGIVLVDADATPVTVLRDADAAMYQAKERGRARAEMYDETLRYRAAKRLDIEMMLRHALERSEFKVAYQPVMSLPGETTVGVEALLRWEHPERGTLGPTEFIPAAEETGLIVPIGAWVLEEALGQLASWRRTLRGANRLFVAVNLSPRQLLSGDLSVRCRDAVAANHLDPDALCLEITEGAVMQDVEVSVPILRKLSDSGINLAVDDFGSGYSSLSYLKRLPVRILKIDRSFVDGIGHDPDDSAIVRAIVSLGYALGLELCAEGVETPSQRAELAGLGCHTGQGYLWAPAMRAEAFPEWYERRLVTSSREP